MLGGPFLLPLLLIEQDSALVVDVGDGHKRIIGPHLGVVEQQAGHQHMNCLHRRPHIEQEMRLQGRKGQKGVAEAVEEGAEERRTEDTRRSKADF